MSNLPTAEWTETLDRMSAGIAATLADLDRYEAEWAALREMPATGTSPDQLFAWLEGRLITWDAKLSEAANLASSVEGQLGEREAAVGRWHDLVLRWRELVQREMSPTAPS